MNAINQWSSRRIVIVAVALWMSSALAAADPPGGSGYGQGPRGVVVPGQPDPRFGQQPPQTMPAIPPVDTAPLNAAVADAAKARAELKKSQLAFLASGRRFEKSIDDKPNVQAAAHQVKTTQDSLDSATAKATRALKSNPDYQKAVTAARAAHGEVEALRSNSEATPEQRYAAATASLTANKAVSAFESAALAGDAHVVEARAKLAASSEALHKVRQTYETAMHDDPDWIAAKKDVDQKQANVTAADVKVADARKKLADQQAARLAAISAQNTQMPPNGRQTPPTGQPPR